MQFPRAAKGLTVSSLYLAFKALQKEIYIVIKGGSRAAH